MTAMRRILLIVRFLFAQAPDPQGRDEGGQSLVKPDSIQQPLLGSWAGGGKLMQLQLQGCISCSADSPFTASISSKAKSSPWDPCPLPLELDVSLPTHPVALFSSSVFLEQAAATAGLGSRRPGSSKL